MFECVDLFLLPSLASVQPLFLQILFQYHILSLLYSDNMNFCSFKFFYRNFCSVGLSSRSVILSFSLTLC